MGRFNLVDEAWISVLVDKKGTTKLVSLREIFKNTSEFIDLAGDMKIQDFAVMRIILAIMHTVFSRYNAEGQVYEEVEINDKMQQTEDIDDSDKEYYEYALVQTWKDIWNRGRFPDIILKYLECWHDRFYLYDDRYPFFQVSKEYVSVDKIKNKNVSEISGKNINRTITESNNKIALFAPKYENDNNKEILSNDQIARWLISFQGYTGLSDKTAYGREKYKMKNSKGWLFDLGGIYLKGENLFYTLMLNLVMINNVNKHYAFNISRPSWEFSDKELIEKYLSYRPIDNLAELYTTYSRALYIDPDHNENEAFSMKLIKLPEVEHGDNFLEPMTIYKYNKTGDYKDKFTPTKHSPNKSMRRSFGLISTSYDIPPSEKMAGKQRKPGIIEWLNQIKKYIDAEDIKVIGLSLEDDANPKSRKPINEIYDEMPIKIDILTDLEDDGWVFVINNIVSNTKKIINGIYGGFLKDIGEIRNIKNGKWIDSKIEQIYYLIDKDFRDMLASIKDGDSKDEVKFRWKSQLKKIVYNEAKKELLQANNRDYTIVKLPDRSKGNIASVFNKFEIILYKF